MTEPAAGVHEAAAIGFDLAAEEYERARPSYPVDAVEFITTEFGLDQSSRVLDLAAGTGKFTRLLLPLGASIIAVEPVAGMRAVLEASVAGIEVLDGTAEAIPVEDNSVDAVVCAQAFHWFDGPKALAEIRRVLRPGGGLAVVFNIRDESVEWVHDLTVLTGVDTAPRPHHTATRSMFPDWVEADGGYEPASLATFRYDQPMDAELLVERVLSQSWIAAMPDDERVPVLDRVRDLAQTHPDLAGQVQFSMPYETEVSYTQTLIG